MVISFGIVSARPPVIWEERRGHKPEAGGWSSMAPGTGLSAEWSLTAGAGGSSSPQAAMSQGAGKAASK